METFFQLLVIPFLIFAARVTDVSIGTMRIIFISRGMKYVATFLGFFEIMVWLIAITQIMQHLGSWVHMLAYAGGFTAGCFVGMTLEEKMAMGRIGVRIITQRDATELVIQLKKLGFGITVVNAEGAVGTVKLIYSVIARKDLQKMVNIIHQHNPKAFYSIEDIREVQQGIFPQLMGKKSSYWRRFRMSK